MSATAWSRGWGARVELGDGQARIRDELLRSVRHPSRSWHVAPRMRAYGRSSSTAHRAIHRLASLGIIAIQTRPGRTFGRTGEVRFSFLVRFWRNYPRRLGQLARMTRGGGRLTPRRAPSAGQLELGFLAETGPPDHDANRTSVGFGERIARYGFVPWWRA